MSIRRAPGHTTRAIRKRIDKDIPGHHSLSFNLFRRAALLVGFYMSGHVVFLGNCQAGTLALLYRTVIAPETGERVTYLASYVAADEKAASEVASAGLLVRQRLDFAPKTDGLTTVGRTVEFPLVSAPFLWPCSGRRRAADLPAPHLDPLGAYNAELGDSFLDNLIARGVPPAEAVEHYRAADIVSLRHVDRMREMVLDKQRARDEACDGYEIASYIDSRINSQKLFRTANHPELPLTFHLAAQVFQRMGVSDALVAKALDYKGGLFPDTEAPIHPSILAHFNLAYADANTTYRFYDEGRFTFADYAYRYMEGAWNAELYLGFHLAQIGNADEAIATLRRALDRSPGSSRGHSVLANLLSGKGNLDEAVIHSGQATQLAPENDHLKRVHEHIRSLSVAKHKVQTQGGSAMVTKQGGEPFAGTRRLVAGGAKTPRDAIEVRWSEAYLGGFRRILSAEAKPRAKVDLPLARVMLDYAVGEIRTADANLFEIALAYLDAAAADAETFISLIFAFFVGQHFDVVGALLADKFGFAAPLQIGVSAEGPGHGRVRWTIDNGGMHDFTFDASVFSNDSTRTTILLFQWIFPLVACYAASNDVEAGSIILNQGDMGSTPGLAYSDNRPSYFLIPDYIFVPSKGYAHHREVFSKRSLPWLDRRPVAMWRGGTTGVKKSQKEWRSLERIRLCEAARRSCVPELFDVGLSSIVQFSDPAVIKEIEDSGFLANFIPSDTWQSYRYLIDIDGNSSPWSNLFQKLLTGSTVVKVESYRGIQQWYYDLLEPWKNYVPVSPDLGDLEDKVRWLSTHDHVAQSIGQAGLALAGQLTFAAELRRSVPVIASAFRYYRGAGLAAPFGRVASDELKRNL
jgi:tetratricopeptide (TPR) repeat protein